MPIDHSKGRYKVIRENGDLVGTIDHERCIRLDGEIVYSFDEEGCIYDPDNELIGLIGDDKFETLNHVFLYRIEPI